MDFDAGKVRKMKGFVYLPRQDASLTACVKQYSLEVSMDGKNWRNAVDKGTFDSSKKAKIVELKTPVQARYIRFTALSSQTGTDYAGGAEFSIIAD